MRTWNSQRTGWIAALASFAVMASLLQGCTRDPNVRKAKYLASGQKYAAQGKEKEAIIQFSNAVKIDPHYAAAHFELGKAFLKTGSGLAGYTELRKTIDLDPKNVDARLLLGQIYLASHRPVDSAQQAKAILALDPKNADAYALLSGTDLAENNRDQALKDIQQALALKPDQSSYHAQLGAIQASDPATMGAGEDQLRKAASLDPKNESAHLLLSGILEKKGDKDGAIREAQAATQAGPKDVRSWVALAGLYFRQGNKQQAEATLMQATDVLHDSTQGADLLRSFYEQTGQAAHGADVYAGLVNKYPKSLPIKMAYTHLLLDQGNFAKVQELADQLSKTNGDDPEVESLNGMLLMRAGKVNDAYTLLSKASKNSPDNAPLKYWLGEANKAKGDISAAEQNFRDAVRLRPDNLLAQKALAAVALQQKDFGLLGEMSQKILAARPNDPDGYLWRGLTELHQNQTAPAEADFEMALKKDPKNENALTELGGLRLQEKRGAEGTQLLQQALDNNPNAMGALQLLVTYDLYQHQPQKAVDLVKQQIARSPQNAALYVQLANLQLITRDFANASTTAEKAMQMNPKDGGAVLAYTRAVVAQGNPSAAVAKWQAWSTTHPNDARGDVILGTLSEAQSNASAAMDYYKKALAIQPDQPVAANNLAFLMLQNNQDLDVAMTLAQTARRALPHSPNTADTLAWAYYKKGIYGSARDLLEDAAKDAPDNASIQYHLGMTYSKLGDKASASTHLKKAVSLAPNTQVGGDANKALASLG